MSKGWGGALMPGQTAASDPMAAASACPIARANNLPDLLKRQMKDRIGVRFGSCQVLRTQQSDNMSDLLPQNIRQGAAISPQNQASLPQNHDEQKIQGKNQYVASPEKPIRSAPKMRTSAIRKIILQSCTEFYTKQEIDVIVTSL
mmetsp:Transcript_40900/g.123305  ORF Transcript_40900/g.123305 Transcript_40900/m.123305 type:complete len:145 (-) Transcript_40900:1079-1513(-)